MRVRAWIGAATIGCAITSLAHAQSAAGSAGDSPDSPATKADLRGSQPDPSARPSTQPPERPADETRPTRAEGGGPPGLTFEVRPKAEYTFDGELRESEGSVNIFRAELGLGVSAPLGDRARLLVNAQGEWSNYDFSDVGDLLPGGREPMDNGYLFRLAPGVVYQIDQCLGITGGGLFEAAWESGADIGEAWTIGGYGGVRYAFTENLTATFGLIGKSRLEDDAIFVPLLGMQWKINDKLTLENEGLGLRLSAQVSQTLRASIFGRWELREYRLADDGAIPDGILRDSRIPVGVGLEWRPSPRVSITGYVGAVVYQKYEFDDDEGDRLESDRTRPAPMIGISGSIAF